ncbi:hypothetical protein [Streptomyces sp. NPDC059063]
MKSLQRQLEPHAPKGHDVDWLDKLDAYGRTVPVYLVDTSGFAGPPATD